jgi:hypothetical protein
VALLEKRRFLNNHSGDFPQVILILSQSRAEHIRKNQTLNKMLKIINLYKQENNEQIGGHHIPSCEIYDLCPSTCDLRCEVVGLSSALQPVGRVPGLPILIYSPHSA